MAEKERPVSIYIVRVHPQIHQDGRTRRVPWATLSRILRPYSTFPHKKKTLLPPFALVYGPAVAERTEADNRAALPAARCTPSGGRTWGACCSSARSGTRCGPPGRWR